MVKQVKELRDINQIKERLSQLLQMESNINDELDAILSQKNELEQSTFTMLEKTKPILINQKESAGGLLTVVDKTYKTAHQMSSKVRQLDMEQSRVKQCSKILNEIKDCKQCAMGVKRAIQDGHFIQAADFIRRFLSYDIETIESIYANIPVPFEDPETLGSSVIEELKESQMTLTHILMDEFDSHVQNGDIEAMVNVFKLFPLIGKKELGLDKFSAYICEMIAKNVNLGLKRAAETQNNAVYVECLTIMFEAIANTIDRQESLIFSHYGLGSLIIVIVRLQREADIQSSILVNSILDSRQVQRKVDVIKHYENNKKATKTSIDQIDIDIKDLDIILTELALVCNKGNFFDRYMRSREVEEIDKVEKHSVSVLKVSNQKRNNISPLQDKKIEQSNLVSERLPIQTKLNELVHSCINQIAVIADFFIQKGISKALSIDTKSADSLTSSCVDDVFYVFKTVIQKGLNTGDPDCLCVIINSISKSLELDYMVIFQRQLSSFFGKQEESQVSQIAPTLNNIDMSCQYIQKLCSSVEQELSIVFSKASPMSLEQIKACLSTVTDFATKFKIILKTWLENYFKQTLKPRVRGIITNLMMDSKYTLTEEEYAYAEANGSFSGKFYHQFTRLISPFEASFTPTNMSNMLTFAIESFTREWETKILQFKFNVFGALKFEKECRACISMLLPHSASARESFQRLNQISLLLNLEEVSDIYEYWGSNSGSIRWRLTVGEVKKVLAIRSDFSPADISKLSL